METAPHYFIAFQNEMRAFVRHVDERLDRVDEQLDAIATKVNHHSDILSRLELFVGDHEERISRLERSVARLTLKT